MAGDDSGPQLTRFESQRIGVEFELLHTNDIGARPLASPALVDGTW